MGYFISKQTAGEQFLPARTKPETLSSLTLRLQSGAFHQQYLKYNYSTAEHNPVNEEA